MKGDVSAYNNVHVYDEAQIEIEPVILSSDESLVWIKLGADQKTNLYLTESSFLSLAFQVNAFLSKAKAERLKVLVADGKPPANRPRYSAGEKPIPPEAN